MIALLQRVSRASVSVDDQVTGSIDSGLLVLVGFRRGDQAGQIDRFIQRILDYRVFADDDGRMNLSLRDTGGGLLLVPQFTLAADTTSGNRPGFSPAAAPDVGEMLFDELIDKATSLWPATATGVFGAHMEVSLVNDGPVTFWLET